MKEEDQVTLRTRKRNLCNCPFRKVKTLTDRESKLKKEGSERPYSRHIKTRSSLSGLIAVIMHYMRMDISHDLGIRGTVSSTSLLRLLRRDF